MSAAQCHSGAYKRAFINAKDKEGVMLELPAKTNPFTENLSVSGFLFF